MVTVIFTQAEAELLARAVGGWDGWINSERRTINEDEDKTLDSASSKLRDAINAAQPG